MQENKITYFFWRPRPFFTMNGSSSINDRVRKWCHLFRRDSVVRKIALFLTKRLGSSDFAFDTFANDPLAELSSTDDPKSGLEFRKYVGMSTDVLEDVLVDVQDQELANVRVLWNDHGLSLVQ
jgi:hypothetical protein